jgi:HPt (histidine-containing phosphotransfer) domain-containing protein
MDTRGATMSRAGRASRPPAGSSPAGHHADPIGLTRIQRLRDSLSGKDAALAELVDLFLADLPLRTAAITAAVERAEAAALALNAHALRSGAGNFGAARLDDLCGRLEQTGLRGALGEARALLAELAPEGERVRRALLAVKSKLAANSPTASAPPKR